MRSQCTCAHVDNDVTVASHQYRYNIKSVFSCTSTCVIYCIRCSLCNIKYIGETSRQLNTRIGEHIRNIKNKSHLKPINSLNEDASVAKHFNLPNHSLENFKVQCLKHGAFGTEKRRCEEKRFIYLLNTVTPSGLNKRFAFA